MDRATLIEARQVVEEHFGVTEVVIPVLADQAATVEFGEAHGVVIVVEESEPRRVKPDQVIVSDAPDLRRWYRPRLEVVDWKVGKGLYRVRNADDAATAPVRINFHVVGKGRHVTPLLGLETDGTAGEASLSTAGTSAAFEEEFAVLRSDGSRVRFGRFVAPTSAAAEALTAAPELKVGDVPLVSLAPQGIARGSDAPSLTSRGAVREGETATIEMTSEVPRVAVRHDLPPPLLYAVAKQIKDGSETVLIHTQQPSARADVPAGTAGDTLRFAATYVPEWDKAETLAREAAAAVARLVPALQRVAPDNRCYEKR